jgi:FixJ family two-component response regulator
MPCTWPNFEKSSCAVGASFVRRGEFLTKSFLDQALLDEFHDALHRDRAMRQQWVKLAELRKRYATLTAGEREVMAFEVSGMFNNQIPSEPGTSEIAVKIHRGHAVAKMEAQSLVERVRMTAKLDIAPGTQQRNAAVHNVATFLTAAFSSLEPS